MRYNLSDCQWQVKGFYPWVPFKDRSMETGKELMGITDWMEAQVPGGVHYDLYKAGLIPYPYRDMESLKCEWVEKRWWLYRTKIPQEIVKGSRAFLVFQGIDYRAVIYVNGRERCRHEGMFEPIRIDVSEEASRGNGLEVQVLLMGAPEEMGQIGKTSETFTQKSRFNYKWDFSTRLVNLGIWEECYLSMEEEAVFELPYFYTDYKDNTGYVGYRVSVTQHTAGMGNYAVHAVLQYGGQRMEQKVNVCAGSAGGCFEVKNPQLWYPNGSGEQPLYHLTLELESGDCVLDRCEAEVGIRSLDYRYNEGGPESALPYTFCINGTPVYIKGVNMTPLDHIYGNVTEQHYEHIVKLMKNMNVNMVRVWGGGLIEKDIFYSLCDRYGILVWQEFIQSSSGIDNVPSKKPEFLHLLAKTASAAIQGRRSHTALTVWSGGNELTDENYVPSDCGDENIAMLRELVKTLDPQRLFLPTSASGPNEYINRDKGVSHDIHGNWNYMGNPEHYDLYSQSDSLFHSEFGTEGMCSTRSLDKFVSRQYQGAEPAENNVVYRHHGEWWCTYDRDRKLFGELEDLEQMSKCSQWIQAEGLRFILESNRRRKFHNSGSIIWQINEPWPNVSCTSLADYYLEPKMAYYWCKKSFGDVAVSLDYRKLDYSPGERFEGDIYLDQERTEADGTYALSWEVLDMKGGRLSGGTTGGTCSSRKMIKAASVSFLLPERMEGLFAVRILAEAGKKTAENTYFFGCGTKQPYQAAVSLQGSLLKSEVLQEKEGGLKIRLQNEGEYALLHIAPYCEEEFDLICDQAYLTLFPGESTEIEIQYTPKFHSGFLNCGCKKEKERPQIKWDCFNR